MLQFFVAQLRRPIDNVIAGIVGKLVVALPLLVAFVFLVSALNNYLHTIWGPVGANLAVAGLFFIIAAVAAVAVSSKKAGDQPASREPAAKTPVHKAASAETSVNPVQNLVQGIANMSAQERDLALSVAATALPVILPRLLKLSARNIKTIGFAAAAYYLLVRRPRHRSPADDVRK